MVDRAQKLRLLYIPSHFPPSAAAGVHRVMRVCRYLPRDAFEIEVLCRNLGADPGGQELLRLVENCVLIHRVDLGGKLKSAESPMEPPVAQRSAEKPSAIRKYLRCGITPLRHAREFLMETPDKHVAWNEPMVNKGRTLCSSRKFDLLMTSGPPHSMHLVGLQLKKIFGIPWVADFRDPWARRPWDVSHNPWGQWLLPRYERDVVKTADAVLLNTKATYNDFIGTYPDLPSSKFHWMPNGMDPDLPGLIEPWLAARASTSEERAKTITLLHAGSLYGNRRPDGLLDAMVLLKAQGVRCKLLQIGTVDNSISLFKKIEELGLSQNVECLPRVPHSEVLKLMADVDLHIVLQPDGPLMIPGKVYEMIAYPQPIVAICDSPVTIEVVEKAGGTHAASRDPVGIAKAIQSAIQMRGDQAFNEQRKTARSEFDGRLIVERLGMVLETVSKRKQEGVSS